MYFKGDILITDPCYLMKDDENDDWERTYYGKNLGMLGFTNYLVADTLYGDWSCTTFNSDIGKKKEGVLGEFCADAGEVCVVLLEDVLKYNPNFDYHITKPWTTTLIKDFDGDVSINVINAGKNESVRVIGKGNINFFTMQTGL